MSRFTHTRKKLSLAFVLAFASPSMAFAHSTQSLSDKWECISCIEQAKVRSHAGTFADPKPFDEETVRGAIHRGPGGFYRAEFNGVRAPHDALPEGKKSTTQWTFLAERAGTFESPRFKGDPTYPGAIHYDDGKYYRSRVTRQAAGIIDQNTFELVTTVRHFIVTSDPQYPWSDKTNKPGDTESTSERKRRSKQLITEQYHAINRFRQERGGTIPVMVNGDITAFGHGDELTTMKRLLDILSRFPGPVFVGLGNHDYENNVNDCANNGCARDMLQWLDNYVTTQLKPPGYDLSKEYATLYEAWTGSLSYWHVSGGTGFIQFNNYPGYTKNFSSGRLLIDTKRDFRIKSDMAWFKKAIADTKYNSDFTIINMHDIGNAASSEYFKVIADRKGDGFGIAAIFAGHYHDAMGVWRNRAELRDMPVFISGAAAERTFLIAEHHDTQRLLRVYGVTGNDTSQRKLLAEIPTDELN
jgi:hypothetical protein